MDPCHMIASPDDLVFESVAKSIAINTPPLRKVGRPGALEAHGLLTGAVAYPLHAAAMRGCMHQVRVILALLHIPPGGGGRALTRQQRAYMERRDDAQRTALDVAEMYGHHSIANTLRSLLRG